MRSISQRHVTLPRNGEFSLELVRGDMRHIPFVRRFDAVINMFSAFGYLESEADDQQVLEAVHDALKPGGSALIDMLNREWVIANNIENEWRVDEDGTTILEHRELDLLASRNYVSFSIIGADGVRRESDGAQDQALHAHGDREHVGTRRSRDRQGVRRV